MEKNLVSVIMPTKDTDEKMLKEAIESILNQTYKNIEFIIICDGSEKNYNYVKKIKDTRIIILKNEESIGFTKSLNKGLEIAKGEYIARMDSDDISLPNRLQMQVDFMEKHKDIDISSTLVRKFGNSNDYIINLLPNEEGCKAQLFLYSSLTHLSVMFRKSFLEKHNLKYDGTCLLAQDYEFWSRCKTVAKIKFIPKLGALYRIHNTQMTSTKKIEQTKTIKKIYERNLKELNLEVNNKYMDYMFFLSGRENIEVTKQELIGFINIVINQNNKLQIYDSKYLKRVLYYNYVLRMFTMKKKIVNIKYILKSHIIGLTMKYIGMILLLHFGFYK